MTHPIASAMLQWEQGVERLRRAENRFLASAPWSPERDAARRACEALAVEVDNLLESILSRVHCQPAAKTQPARQDTAPDLEGPVMAACAAVAPGFGMSQGGTHV
ncbi:MAG: hypothetical protein NVS2B4_12180 [Ramlibacter sp.]